MIQIIQFFPLLQTPQDSELSPCLLRLLISKQIYTNNALEKAERDFPQSWDWRNVNGTDWVGGPMDQADCGSCYMVSTMRMMTARNRIRLKNPQSDAFSISFPLHCSEYNQGCNGGYAFLASKWSQDVGLIPSVCFPYSTGGKCGGVNKKCVEEYMEAGGSSGQKRGEDGGEQSSVASEVRG